MCLELRNLIGVHDYSMYTVIIDMVVYIVGGQLVSLNDFVPFSFMFVIYWRTEMAKQQ